MTGQLEVVRLDPAPEQLRYTFGGGGEPLVRVAPGTVVELTAEDCFGGRVRGADDLPSRVCEFPYLNPVTGPVHVEGAERGDTLAVHIVEIAPLRNWAVSTTFPHFGALTSTHRTAMLHDPLEEVVWVYEVDRDRGTCLFRPRGGGPRRSSCRWTRCTARSEWHPRRARCSRASRRARTAGTWTPPSCAPASRSTSA